MAGKVKVLFICQHNSGRSQMAEAFLRRLYGEHFEVQSAGLKPAATINPMVVRVMHEAGFDLTGKNPQSVFELFKKGKLFDHVVTVCHDSESQCPIYPGLVKRWHWPFPDPAMVEGSDDEKLDQVRKIRNMIEEWLLHPPQGTIDFNALVKNESR